MDNNNHKYVLPDHKLNPEGLTTPINVDPKKYVNQIITPLNHIKNNWFINLTDITIPPTVSCLLQLEGNFCLLIDNCKKTAMNTYMNLLKIWKAIIVTSMNLREQRFETLFSSFY